MPRGWPVALIACVVGCHGPAVVVTSPPPAAPPAVSADLPVVSPTRIEPPLASLPTIDPKTADATKLFAANATGFRGLSEQVCATLAAQQSSVGNLLDKENAKPGVRVVTKRQPCADDAGDQLLRDVRELAAAEARNRDTAEAVERFYQLADAEARTELLAAGLKSFDELRDLAPRAREAGLPMPDEDELLRQRSKLLGDVEAAEAGIKLLNVELQARLGLSVKRDERLWPTGSFEISTAAIDAEAAVQTALERRPDLRLLRRLYHGLTADTLPTVQDQLRTVNGLAGTPTLPTPRSFILQRQVKKITEQLKAATTAEVTLRREQLFSLTAEREKLAAAEVRVAAVQMASAARRVALAKSRVESWQAKIDKVKKDDKPLDRLPLELDWYKARAELVQEVMAWHRWHAKFRAAQGQLIPAAAEESPVRK